MIRTLLADDEALARDRLRDLLRPFAELVVVGDAADGEQAIEKIVTLQPDLVFLDVQMPGCSGMDVVRSLGQPRPKIVFCTGFDQYAVEAFELAALDYLLKPVSRVRLSAAIERIRSTHRAAWDAGVTRVARAKGLAMTRFLARRGASFRVVAQADVLYFGSEDGLTALHTAKERHWMEPTLNDLEQQLDPAVFFRVSRAVIVRLDAVVELRPLPGGHGEAVLRDGACLAVSRRRMKALIERLEGRG